MDGNGRWADRRGLPRLEGHRRGADSVRTVTRAARAAGLQRLTLYAFSEQNWGRPIVEVNGLMQLLRDYLLRERAELMDNDIRLTTIGRIERLPDFVREPLAELEEATRDNASMVLCLALSYGGREEIARAVRRLAERVQSGELAPADLDEALIAREMDVPDPDFVIRTSGEHRISNFLLWQIAYAELYFTETLWPDFGKPELLEALSSFGRRDRRFGLVKSA